MTMRKLLAVVLATALAVGLTASTAAAQDAPDCSKETYAVVSAAGDAAMAELIASWQVLDTECVVAPEEAKAAIDGQQVVVLGGTKAVPDSAVAGLAVIARLAGADRVATAKAVLAWIDQRDGKQTRLFPHAPWPIRCDQVWLDADKAFDLEIEIGREILDAPESTIFLWNYLQPLATAEQWNRYSQALQQSSITAQRWLDSDCPRWLSDEWEETMRSRAKGFERFRQAGYA